MAPTAVNNMNTTKAMLFNPGMPETNELVGGLQVGLDGVSEFIPINKVFASIVGRGDVNAFDLAVIGFVEQFEGFQVVAFDEQIPRLRAA